MRNVVVNSVVKGKLNIIVNNIKGDIMRNIFKCNDLVEELFYSDRVEMRLVKYMGRRFVKQYANELLPYIKEYINSKDKYITYSVNKKDGSKEIKVLNSKRIQSQVKKTLLGFSDAELVRFSELSIKSLSYLYNPLNAYNGQDRSTYVALLGTRILSEFTSDARDIDEVVETAADQLATYIINLQLHFKLITKGIITSNNKKIAIYTYNKDIVNNDFISSFSEPEMQKYARYGITSLFVRETQKGFRSYLPEAYRRVKGNIIGGYENSAFMAQTGHIKKARNQLSKAHLELLNRLGSQEYTLIDSIWKCDQVMEEVALKIANIKSLDALDLVNSKEDEDIYKTYLTVKREIKYLKDMVYNKGKSLYISWNYGPDNGRVYCESGVFGFQKGWINHLFQLKKGFVLNNQAMIIYSDLADKYENKYKDTKDIKYKIMYLGYREAVLKSIAGKPTGVMVELDAKASGTAMQGLALRSEVIFKFTGQTHKFIEQTYDLDMYIEISKGIRLIKTDSSVLTIEDIVKLTNGNQREIGKSAFRGFVYGAGEAAVNNDVLGDLELSQEEYKLDWDYFLSNYESMVPEMAKLRKYLLNLSYKLKEKGVRFLDYKALDGFPCTITALSKEGVEHKRRDVLFPGELTLVKRIVSEDHLGVRIVGAFSHHLDSTLLRSTLSQLFMKGIDIVPIHDAFMIHGNFINDLNEAYNNAQNMLLKSNALESYLVQLFKYIEPERAESSAKVASERLMNNTDIEIEGGLFID